MSALSENPRRRAQPNGIGTPMRVVGRAGWQPLGETGAEAALLFLAVGLPLLYGGRQPEVDSVAACVAPLALALLLLLGRCRVPAFAWLLISVCALTALQLVPLPLAWLRAIAPASVRVIEVSFQALGELPALHPISLDASATTWELQKLATAALVLVLAHELLLDVGRRRRFVAALALGGTFSVVWGFVSSLGGPPPAPSGWGLVASTAFFNGNHAAAFLLLCTTVSTGWTLTLATRERRMLGVLATAWLGAGVFMTLSRGGILALGLAFACMAVLIALRRAQVRTSRAAVVVPAAAAAVLLFAAVVAYDAVIREFRPALAEGSWGKLALWPAGWAMAWDSRWVGIGRGAFASVFPRYLDDLSWAGADITFAYLENEYLQWAAEWGLPATLVILLTGVWLLQRTARRGRRDALALAACAGLLGLAVHNLVDYNLELTSLQLPAVALVGLLSAGARASTDPSLPGRVERAFLPAFTALALALGVWGVWKRPAESAQEMAPVIARAARGELPEGTARSLIKGAVIRAIERHPADWFPHWVMGRVIRDEQPAEALEWLGRAAFLNPTGSNVHADSARSLARLGRTRQALVEYRLALVPLAGPLPLLREALALCHESRDLVLLLGERADLHASALGLALDEGRLQLARAHWSWMQRHVPLPAESLKQGIRLAQLDERWGDALELARALARLDPRPEALSGLARAAQQAGRAELARETLERAARRYPHSLVVGQAQIEVLLAAGLLERARTVARGLVDRLAKPAERASAFELLGRVEEAGGRPHEAAWAREQARRLRALP